MFHDVTQAERNVFLLASRNKGDFETIARALGISAQAASEEFENARQKIIFRLHGKPDGRWMSVDALAAKIEAHPNWVTARLKPYVWTGIYCTVSSKRSAVRYPPSICAIVGQTRQMEQNLPGINGHLPISRLCKLAGMREKRARRLLDGFGITPELRLDKQGHAIKVYRPESLTILISLEAPPAGEWHSVSEISTQVGKTKEWVVARAAELGVSGEVRKSKSSGRRALHIPPNSSKKIIGESRLPKSGEWLTTWRLSRELGKSTDWVCKMLREGGHEPSARITATGHKRYCYPPSVLQALRTEAETA